MMENMETLNPKLNSTVNEFESSSGPDLNVVIIIVVIILIILVVLAAVLLFKFVSRLAGKWREQRAEEALARAIHIYNSQEPLQEPDLIYMRPGDPNGPWKKKPRSESEIAFVHLDGRIDRFRLPISLPNKERRDSGTTRKKVYNKSEAKPGHSHGTQNRLVKEEEDVYTPFQPAGVKPQSGLAQYLAEDCGDTVFFGGCDIPPSYEEALEMPVAVSVGSSMNHNVKDNAVGGKFGHDYYNIQTAKKSKDFVVPEGD